MDTPGPLTTSVPAEQIPPPKLPSFSRTLISPLMLFWISRMWFLARRGQLDADPVLFATTDRASYLCGLCILAIGLLASTGVASG